MEIKFEQKNLKNVFDLGKNSCQCSVYILKGKNNQVAQLFTMRIFLKSEYINSALFLVRMVTTV